MTHEKGGRLWNYRKRLGQRPEVARDLVTWLSEQFFSSRTKEQVQISVFVARQKVNVVVFEQVICHASVARNLSLADELILRGLRTSLKPKRGGKLGVVRACRFYFAFTRACGACGARW